MQKAAQQHSQALTAKLPTQVHTYSASTYGNTHTNTHTHIHLSTEDREQSPQLVFRSKKKHIWLAPRSILISLVKR